MDLKFLVSVDTEENNWGWASNAPIECTNTSLLPRLVRFFERLRIRPTFFVNYQVLIDPSSRDIIRDLASEEWMEIGSHVHPWNTPPFDGAVHRRTMLYDYPADLQRAKIGSVTPLVEEVTSQRPVSFRAGRFGFGPTTSIALVDEGYKVDSSVTPYWNWCESSHGPNYIGAPLGVYRIKAGSDVLRPDEEGELVEVPLTSGYTRLATSSWRQVAEALDNAAAKAVHLGGMASRIAGLRRVILSPEAYPVEDMLALSRRVISGGTQHLHLFLHSSSLQPGLTPFTPTSRDVERLFDRFERLLDQLQGSYRLSFATVSEAADLQDAGRVAGSSARAEPVAYVLPRGADRQSPRRPKGMLDPQYYGGGRALVAYFVRYCYWVAGGYRKYRRIRWEEARRLVFVCRGNICRSAYAEYWAKAQGLSATSIGVDTGRGNRANAMALKVAKDRDLLMEEHRTTPIEDFEASDGDLFVAMEPSHIGAIEAQHWAAGHQITLLGLWIDSQGAVVLDPYGQDERRFAHCFALIEDGIRAMNGQKAQT